MVQDTIQAVKEAEEKAAQLLKTASVNGKDLVDAAKLQAEKVKDEAAKDVKARAASADGELAEKGRAYLEESMKEAGKEIDALKEAAAKKTDEAVAMIISELV